MPAANPQAHGLSRDERTNRAVALLDEALQIIDGLGDCPELGARLQSIVEALRERINPYRENSAANEMLPNPSQK